MDQNKVTEILQKAEQIEKQIELKKKENQEICNKLIELKTRKQQVIEELAELGIKPEDLDLTIEKLTKEVNEGVRRFEEESSKQQ